MNSCASVRDCRDALGPREPARGRTAGARFRLASCSTRSRSCASRPRESVTPPSSRTCATSSNFSSAHGVIRRTPAAVPRPTSPGKLLRSKPSMPASGTSRTTSAIRSARAALTRDSSSSPARSTLKTTSASRLKRQINDKLGSAIVEEKSYREILTAPAQILSEYSAPQYGHFARPLSSIGR